MANRVLEKKSKWPSKDNFGNKASEMSISTEIDLLITILIMLIRLDASFPVKGAKNVKHFEKNVN